MLYKRVLLKISGEALMGQKDFGHDPEAVNRIAADIEEVVAKGVELCLVVGGGNIYRGVNAESLGISRSCGDHMGMLGTVMNALVLQNALKKLNLEARVMSAIAMDKICESYIQQRADISLTKHKMVIFAAGTGNPFFTTDTAAVLRAIEMNCDLLLKGTQVDGVYSDNPSKNSEATRFEHVTYQKVIQDNLKVMDITAVALAQENDLPIKVFSMHNKGNLNNQGTFTLISKG
jgi:uridylate kinase